MTTSQKDYVSSYGAEGPLTLRERIALAGTTDAAAAEIVDLLDHAKRAHPNEPAAAWKTLAESAGYDVDPDQLANAFHRAGYPGLIQRATVAAEDLRENGYTVTTGRPDAAADFNLVTPVYDTLENMFELAASNRQAAATVFESDDVPHYVVTASLRNSHAQFEQSASALTNNRTQAAFAFQVKQLENLATGFIEPEHFRTDSYRTHFLERVTDLDYDQNTVDQARFLSNFVAARFEKYSNPRGPDFIDAGYRVKCDAVHAELQDYLDERVGHNNDHLRTPEQNARNQLMLDHLSTLNNHSIARQLAHNPMATAQRIRRYAYHAESLDFFEERDNSQFQDLSGISAIRDLLDHPRPLSTQQLHNAVEAFRFNIAETFQNLSEDYYHDSGYAREADGMRPYLDYLNERIHAFRSSQDGDPPGTLSAEKTDFLRFLVDTADFLPDAPDHLPRRVHNVQTLLDPQARYAA